MKKIERAAPENLFCGALLVGNYTNALGVKNETGNEAFWGMVQ